MPRAEPGTPKWLANKMKAKGLQKLKWYCQMCEKQCRDENGFKCHRLSEAHQRQMQIFCQDANKFMDDYSAMFEKEFMRLMKTKYCRARILANTVYTNMISDKSHIHMNSTVWVTLTDFVLYLGKTGKCKIEQTERGWYLEYIDREKIEREKAYQERKKIEYSYEELKEKKINEAIQEAKKKGTFIESEYTALQKKNDEKIIISSIKTNNDTNTNKDLKPNVNIFLDKSFLKQDSQNKKKSIIHEKNTNHPSNAKNKRPLSELDLLILENEEKKKQKNNDNSKLKNSPNNVYTSKLRSEHKEGQKNKHENEYPNDNLSEESDNNIWIFKNIIVKIIDKTHKYYNHKGVIKYISRNDKYKCEIKLNNSTDMVYAYQKQLETVIPNIGRKVVVLRGKYKGSRAVIKKVLSDEGLVVVNIYNKSLDKFISEERMSYDDVSKLNDKI
ncbi:DNA/RNA-binding protein KIN17, putative [Plasmodium sp. gorilla clade G2]|uniref:DNA/RNA-binding protein KIN17, putative n=1 Tax=Plasmodium sp. gorilla clade G2 TaxID=880535 RepID=UPI000D207CA9|nr:DNA/RNA-binding protein KIN17, putative [Plasmodium sp. gorilla clade G2]SOV19841.1 DNA/RNA-binding protein KIN17, putative [Plasmodium sp. gorilla clade G2]